MFEFLAVPAIASFSALALTLSAIYLLISKVGGNLASVAETRRDRKKKIPFEPGRFVQQEAHHIERYLRRHGTATLIFCTSLSAMLAVGRQDWWPEMPIWAWWIALAGMLALLAYVQFRFIMLAIYRHRLKILRDDHVVVADRLNDARTRGNRVFHSIPMREGIIDHVIVGKKGMFAIQIVRPPSGKFTHVRLEDEKLIFEPPDVEKGIRHIRRFTRPIQMLSKRLIDETGISLRITPIIVVPNCGVEPSSSKGCMLVSPENCIMFVGWNDPSAHLMNDDIQKIADWLVARCRARPFRKWKARVHGGDIGYA